MRGDSVDRTLYTTSQVKVTRQGTAFPKPAYYKSSSGAYLDVGETLYYAGKSEYYYERSKYADAGELYWSDGDETVSVGTDEYTAPLYTAGTAHSGGLYTNFKLAKLTTRDVTALTV